MSTGSQESQQEQYDVEEIAGHRTEPVSKAAELFVKWKGYPSEQNSWEPIGNFLTGCGDEVKRMVDRYFEERTQSTYYKTSNGQYGFKKRPERNVQKSNKASPKGAATGQQKSKKKKASQTKKSTPRSQGRVQKSA